MTVVAKRTDLYQHMISAMELIVTELLRIYADNSASIRQPAKHVSAILIGNDTHTAAAYRMPFFQHFHRVPAPSCTWTEPDTFVGSQRLRIQNLPHVIGSLPQNHITVLTGNQSIFKIV